MAGSGSRLGAAVPKAFVPLGGKPMWRHAAETFAAIESCGLIVFVHPPTIDFSDDVMAFDAEIHFPNLMTVRGGARRQDSVRIGLDAVAKHDPSWNLVAIHDAARPFVSAELIRATVLQSSITGAAVSAAPVRDTIKRVKDGRIVETLDRSALWLAQTPQCFRLDLIRSAHEAAESNGWDVTDDCALLERLGHAVAVVRGDAWNFKITEPEDLSAAEALLARRRPAGKETS